MQLATDKFARFGDAPTSPMGGCPMRNGQPESRVIAPTHNPRAVDTPNGSPICVVGTGYVGTVVAACLASLGRTVVGLETDDAKLRTLRSGRVPFHEPGLHWLVSDALRGGTLSFTDDPRLAAADAGVVFLCVGSPPRDDGSADLRPLEAAGRSISRWARPGQVFVIKITAPVGTNRWLASLMADAGDLGSAASVHVVSNPEFLRHSAIEDFLHPPRIVLGGYEGPAIDAVIDVYRPILDQRFPGGDEYHRPVLVRTTPAVAEAAKYASNAFLAAKMSFVNEIANICDRIGVDVTEVTRVMGLDPRIGPEFLRAGLGWGGSCLAKDLDALILTAREVGHPPELLQAVREVNERQREVVVAKLCEHLDLSGAPLTLLGLAFKAGTADLRGAPSVLLADRLMSGGARVTAYDPVVRSIPGLPQVIVAADPYEAAEQADALVLVTDWPELRHLDLAALRARMRGHLLVDGRNAFDPRAATEAGFLHQGIGRGADQEPVWTQPAAEAFVRQAS
jgi:UDPglucose 6-dehydrogenase